MKSKLIPLASLFLGLMLIMGSIVAPASAAPNGQTADIVTLTANIPNLGVLTLSDTAVDLSSFSGDFADNTLTPLSITVKSNVTSWTLTQQIEAASSNYTPGAETTLNLNYKVDSGSWTPIGTNATTINSSSPRGVNTYGVSYQIKFPWDQPAATYTIPINYTLSY